MDSPRGRIYLVGQLLDGAPLTPAAGEHFDRCLGCMACMTACPSGVQYDQIIAAAREWTEDGGNPFAAEARRRWHVECRRRGRRRRWCCRGRRRRRRVRQARRGDGAASVRDRLTRAAIFALFPYPERLRVATAPLRALQRTGADRLIARTGLVGRVSPAAEQALRLAPPATRPMPPGRFPERVRGARRAAGRRRHADRVRAVGVLPPR